jgi:phage-related protein
LELIERLDQVPVQYFKKLKSTDDIWEVRARVGSNSFRLLGFIDVHDELVILTNGFAKKSQKTPKNDTKYREALLNWRNREKLIICPEKEVNNE